MGNKHPKDQLTEFYTLPHVRSHALAMFKELLIASQATQIEAQTNMPLMRLMLYDVATNITTENILFENAFVTHLTCPNGVFRHTTAEDNVPSPSTE